MPMNDNWKDEYALELQRHHKAMARADNMMYSFASIMVIGLMVLIRAYCH